MGQRSPITIADATPSNHTFNPLSTQGDDRWIEYFDGSGNGVSAGRWIIRLRSTIVSPTDSLRASGTSRNALMNKVEVQVLLPRLEAVSVASSGYDAIPGPAYHLAFKGVFMLPDRCTETDRDHMRAIVANLMGHSTVVAAISDLDVPY